MNEFTPDELKAYATVEEALRTYPLAPVPAQFLPPVLARIQALDPPPRFRLNWLDYAMSLFVAGLVGLVILLHWSLPPHLLVPIQIQFWLLQQYLGAAYLWLTLLGSLALFAVMIFSAAILFGRGQPSFD